MRKGATGTDIITAMIGLVGRSRRRYGGYIVHVGIMLMFLGFAGQGFHREEQVPLKVGQQTTVGPFTVRHDALRVTTDAQKQMVTADVACSKTASRSVGCSRRGGSSPSTRTSRLPKSRFGAPSPKILPGARFIQRQHAGSHLQDRHQSARQLDLVRVRGDGARDRSRAAARERICVCRGEDSCRRGDDVAAVAVRAVAGACSCAARRESAGRDHRAEVAAREGPAERDHLHVRHVRPQAHWRVHVLGLAAEMREEVAKLVAEGKTREQIYAYYIAKYGSQEPLASPIDEGFNRLAWFFPYLIGATGAASIAVVAFRWSRREAAADASERVGGCRRRSRAPREAGR